MLKGGTRGGEQGGLQSNNYGKIDGKEDKRPSQVQTNTGQHVCLVVSYAGFLQPVPFCH